MNIEKNINKPKMKKFNGKGIKKALVSSMLALTLVANPTSGAVNNYANAKTKPTIKMYGKKNYTVYTGESLKIGKTVPKYKGKKLAAKKFKVTVKKNDVSYPAIANKIKNNKAVTFASSGTYNVNYKATSPVGTTKTATRTISVVDEKYKDAPKSSDGLIVLNDDLSKYADYETITVNGNRFNVVKDYNDFKVEPTEMENDYRMKLKYQFDNLKDNSERGFGCSYMTLGLGKNSIYKNVENLPFQLIGNVRIHGKEYDYSNNILIYEFNANNDVGTNHRFIYFCIVDENGKIYYSSNYSCIHIVENEYKSIPLYLFEDTIGSKDRYQFYQTNESEEILISPPIKESTLIDGKKLTLERKYKL